MSATDDQSYKHIETVNTNLDSSLNYDTWIEIDE